MFLLFLKRLTTLCITFFVLSWILFFLLRQISQSGILLSMPSYTKPYQYETTYQATMELLKLDQPWYVQYQSWICALLQGNLGYSTTYHKPVLEVIASPLKHTLIINLFSFLFAFVLSSLSALYCVFHPRSWWNYLQKALSLLFLSMPMFLFALFFLYLFSFRLSLFPSISTLDSFSAFVLPVFCLTIYLSAILFRYLYPLLDSQMSSMHILSCYARGYSSMRIAKHLFSSLSLPIITLCAQQIPMMLFGSLLLENVFSFQGMGRTLFLALEKRDLFLALALNILYAILYLLSMFVCEMLYDRVDPRRSR